MKIKRKLLISNIVCTILFLLPVKELNLLNQNYSTLSLTTRGYLYDLFLGIIIGLLLYYENKLIHNKYAILMPISLLVGVIIPHHIPYNLQGNLHLLFAYIGFFGLLTLTYLISFNNKKCRNLLTISLVVSILIYIRCGMVNTLSEIIVMLTIMFINLYLNYN